MYYMYGFLPPLNGQQITFTSEIVKYLELTFRILTVDSKTPEKLVNDVLHFSVHYHLEEILYILTTCSLC